jgi:hypothetical protein
MPSRDKVEQFLRDFLFKLEFWGLYVRNDRTNNKNLKTLLALEFNYTHVKKILRELKWEDYSEGPIPDKQYHNSDMWVFGKIVKGQEVYIKVQMGSPGSETICISFHFSEYAMSYPLKNYIV